MDQTKPPGVEGGEVITVDGRRRTDWRARPLGPCAPTGGTRQASEEENGVAVPAPADVAGRGTEGLTQQAGPGGPCTPAGPVGRKAAPRPPRPVPASGPRNCGLTRAGGASPRTSGVVHDTAQVAGALYA